MDLHVINGPNLNRLGRREPAIYGSTTLAEVEALCLAAGATRFVQSNAEHQLIEWVHEAVDANAGIVINPAGLTFSSVSIMDALRMSQAPVIELHISNIHRREPVYHRSLISPVATGVIMGIGIEGYRLALSALKSLMAAPGGGTGP